MGTQTIHGTFYHALKRFLLCGAAVTLASTVFLHFDLENFRVSSSVMLLPVLLLTVTQEDNPLFPCGISSLMILLFRMGIALVSGIPLLTALTINLPGALFYLFYGLFFHLIVKIRAPRVPRVRDFFSFVLCDFVSNICEITLDNLLGFVGFSADLRPQLFVVAMIRSAGACVIIMLYLQYHSLLTRAEHEERYQRLYLMKSHLKGELYFLSKDKASIENSVRLAYQLHAQLDSMDDFPPEISAMALQLACDVHDLKKDYIRIEQGFQEELGRGADRTMEFSAILHILQDSTNRMLGDSPIRLRFSCENDFVTVDHYTLMSILRCLVNNAIEAIQSDKGTGVITLAERREGEDYLFVVEDNGPGIPEKYQKSVFQMGFSTKFDPSTGNLYRGMGLPNVLLMVEEALQGRVLLESRPGMTRFTITIPADILEIPITEADK